MTAIPAKEVTTKQVASIRFGFYDDDEIRKISVKRITSPVIFHNGMAMPDGPYDPALGPREPRDLERCSTCKLGYKDCPGHFGHIELPLPVYNPLVFNTMYRLLRNICFNCYHFRMDSSDVDRYIARLERLAEGQLVEAVSVQLGKTSAAAKEMLDLAADEEGEEEEGSPSPSKGKGKGEELRPRVAGGKRPKGRPVLTSHTLEAMQDCISDFFSHVPKGKCQNCQALNPNVKKQGQCKLFMVWGSAKQLVQNQVRGIVIKAALGAEPSGAAVLEGLQQGMAQELAEAQAKRAGGKRRRSDADGLKGNDSEAEEDNALPPGFDGDDSEEEDTKGGAKKEEEGVGSKRAKKDKGEAVRAAEAAISEIDLQPKFLTPLEAEVFIQRLWQQEWRLLRLIFAAHMGAPGQTLNLGLGLGCGQGQGQDEAEEAAAKQAYHMFFLRVLPVAPNKFRPTSKVGEAEYEHSQTVTLQRVLTNVLELQAVGAGAASTAQPDLGRCMAEWLKLQNNVSMLVDSTMAENADVQGIRQTLEKKEGLFRKNMMGKRVNFAARSVISPDPYIGAGEIGVPPYFASRLSFPERVTAWNVERLRQAVINGAETHPGAVAVEDEKGRIVSLANMPKQKREAIAKQLLSRSSAATGPAGGSKIVYRHLQDGDVMLTNRQPTLHKPGLMAHRARVLRGERTIRMHYANCSTFNADFDGDEINLHLPQDQLGRAEGYNIVHADHQYIVPTDGKPIRGLIQDHVVSGTLLTKKDTFLTRAQYMQLVYIACTPWVRRDPAGGIARPAPQIEMEPPTLIKPRALWTGKQVVSTVISYFTRGMPPLSFSCGGKVPIDYWGRGSGEGDMVFHKGALVAGCADKAVYGKYGLVHAVQELYGGAVAGQLISSFSRLFTAYLQWHGFTCGMDDLLLTEKAESTRTQLLEGAEARALKASADYVGQPLAAEVVAEPGKHSKRLQADALLVASELSERYRANFVETGKAHDMKSSGAMHPLSSDVIKACLPGGQQKAFPHNCLSLMTVTGAKGSLVNFSQISCLLGQQELEGRRVPRMASGKTLPCFRAYDGGARSGGFVGDRFLHGLRPQEYYFHCMAGREGLIDTTVKTSRSGYLQRCLIKNLESLRVSHDFTVRDNCDGSVVQFYYGEDGLDVMNTSYMKQFGFLARNADRFAQQLDLQGARRASEVAHLTPQEREVVEALAERRSLLAKLDKAKEGKKNKYQSQLSSQLPLPARYPASVLGSVPESFADSLLKYINANPDQLLGEKMSKRAGPQAPPSVDPLTFQQLMSLKWMRSLAAAGEAVGVLAAQSVGEPSTQMTLNTFHMAGRGEANVTLGIPRLREILMTAAAHIKTPVMTLPLIKGLGAFEAGVLANRMRRLRLAECLSGISVEERPVAKMVAGAYGRTYTITLQFFDPSQYPSEAQLQFSELASCFKGQFCTRLKHEVERETRRRAGVAIGKMDVTLLGGEGQAAAGAGADDEGEAGGRPRGKAKSEKADGFEDDEEDEELREGKLRFRGGRGEAATYEGPDDEDREAGEAGARRAGLVDDVDEEEEEGRRLATVPEGDEEGGEEGAAAAAGTSGRGEEQESGKKSKKASSKSSKKKAAAKSEGGDGEEGAAEEADKADKEGEEVAAGINLGAGVDAANHRCRVTISLPLGSPKLLMLEVVERVAAATMVRQTPKIDKVYVIPGERGEPTKVQTDGINFEGVWRHADIVDVNGITTNDVYSMLVTYGVEAARATIMREVSSVFGAYGIGVDPRHLGLIADFMTHQGGYRACNRIGIESSVSPFLKMSFETAAHFLTDATLRGSVDDLRSPAARLCVGRVVELGTGSVDIMQQL